MAARGLHPPIPLEFDKIVRFRVQTKSRSGYYRLDQGEKYCFGWFGNWADPLPTGKWSSVKSEQLTPGQAAQYQRDLAEAEARRKAEDAQFHQEAKTKAQATWDKAVPAIDHPYIKNKGVVVHGLRSKGTMLVVPMRDSDGEIWSLQRIFPDGTKLNWPGGKVRGLFHIIPGDNTIVVCEGYATGASIHEATGHTVIVAFNAGNLEPVCRAIRDKNPEATIIVAADNDQWTTRPDGKPTNPGIARAKSAARTITARVVFPEFASLEGKPTDFNDLATREGLEIVRKQFEALGNQVTDELMATEIYDRTVRELNKKHAVVMLCGRCVVMNEVVDPALNRPDITFSSIVDFKHSYSNQFIPHPNGQGQITIANLWLRAENRRQYKGITFAPGEEAPDYYNLYRGFAVEPRKGEWHLFREFIQEVIASGNNLQARYILAWMARIIQDPGSRRPGGKPGVAIVMRGMQGVGKGTLAHTFGSLFGRHYLQLAHSQQVTGRFNSHMKDSLLVFVDEGFWGGDKQAEGVIKNLITEPLLSVEQKGRDVLQVRNNINMIIASNNDWIVPVGPNERRFFVIDIADTHQQDKAYFGAIAKQMDNGGREAMLYDLLHMDISGIDLKRFDKTVALFDQYLNSMTTPQKYWYHRLNEGVLDPNLGYWAESISVDAQYNDYINFALVINDRYRRTPQQFGQELARMCPGITKTRPRVHGQRKYRYIFPSLEECRAQFEAAVQIPCRWENVPDEA